MSSSIATYGWFVIRSTRIVSVCRPVAWKACLKTTDRATNDVRHRSTRATARPSSSTSALPRVGPFGPSQVTEEPVKVIVAVEPAVADQTAFPPT